MLKNIYLYSSRKVSNTDYQKDTWEGRQVWITGFASKEKTSNKMKAASLKVDPFSKCRESHDIEKYSNPDLESTSNR